MCSRPASAHATVSRPSRTPSTSCARGLDIAAHRARRLPPVLAARADLILTMDVAQKRWLEASLPPLRGRVFRLGLPDPAAGLPSGFDVPDPYLGPRAAFEHSLRLIERGVDAWCARIASLASPPSPYSESNR